MTLAVRNTVIYLGAAIAVIMLCGFLFVGYQMLANPIAPVMPSEWEHTWLAWSWQVRPGDGIASLVAAGALGVVATVGLIGASWAFRRVSSAEVYFFALFLIGLAFEQLRLGQLYLLQFNLPAVYGVLLTRFVIIARIGGGFSFFTASLYAVGVDYPRIGTITIVLALLAFLFVYFIPVDTVVVNATLLHPIAGQSSLELALLIVGAMSIFNYVIAGVRGHREQGFLMALAATSIVVAREIALFVPSLAWLVAGVALLVYGVVTFILVTRARFRWY
jgi:hypothetical protein